MKIEGYHIQLFFILLGAFGNGVCMTVIFTQQLYSYASLMVQKFGMAHSRNTTGHWTGLLTCAVMLGRAVSSPFWGYATDNWGRKPVLLFSVFATTVLSVAFGFVVDYPMAVCIRFLIGLTAPIQVVTKTCVAEISPPSFIATATAMYSSSWLLGGVVGSIVGGLLVDPKSSGLATSGFFADWPYLLPNLFTALLSLLTLIGLWLWMKETLKRKEAPLQPPTAPAVPIRSMWTMAKDPLILLLLLLYSLNSFINTSYNELFPLWCWASKSHGGLSFSPSQIGWALAGMNVVLAVGNQITFKWIVKKKGVKWASVWFSLAIVPVSFAIPWISYANNTAGMWVYVITIGFVVYLLDYTVLTGQMVMSNNCVIKHERGKLNGLFMILGSAARAAAPVITDNIFAITTDSGDPFPINFTFSFTLMSFLALVMWFFTRHVPISVEKQKEVILKEEIRKSLGMPPEDETTKPMPTELASRKSSIITEEGYHQFDADSDDEAANVRNLQETSSEKDSSSSASITHYKPNP